MEGAAGRQENDAGGEKRSACDGGARGSRFPTAFAGKLAKMYPTVRFTICMNGGTCGQCNHAAALQAADAPAIAPLSARVYMEIGSQRVELGLRQLRMTVSDLLAESPVMVPTVSEEVFSRWLWEGDATAARHYQDALADAREIPPRIAWRVCVPRGVPFPGVAVEALAADPISTPLIYREGPATPRQAHSDVSKYVPPVGSWTVAPVSLIPRSLLPQERDAAVEYDAIVRQQLPPLDVLAVEYAPSEQRFRGVLSSLGGANVHVLHLIGDVTPDGSSLVLEGGRLDVAELAELLHETGWPELQTVVVSAAGPGDAAATFTWRLMTLTPLPGAVCFQGSPRLRQCVLPFVERLYGALGAGRGLDDAVGSARLRLLELSDTDTADVIAPVLYLRAGSEPPAIHVGDRGLEGILAAADAIGMARDIFEAPDVLQIAENVPATVSQLHRRLIGVGEAQMLRLRENRRLSEMVLREEADRAGPTYTLPSVVAEQLRRVLKMAPSPAPGADGLPPASPPAMDWTLVLRSRHVDVDSIAVATDD